MQQVVFKIYNAGNFKMIVTEDPLYKSLNTVLFVNSLLFFHMSRITKKLIADNKLAVFVQGN